MMLDYRTTVARSIMDFIVHSEVNLDVSDLEDVHNYLKVECMDNMDQSDAMDRAATRLFKAACLYLSDLIQIKEGKSELVSNLQIATEEERAVLTQLVNDRINTLEGSYETSVPQVLYDLKEKLA